MFDLILTFDFVLIFGQFGLFGAQMGYFWVGVGLKTVLGSTHAVEQLSFSMFSLIVNFDFLWPEWANFWVGLVFVCCFWVYSCS